MDKFKKAKKILLKSGFVSKYHFILDVMRGNMSSTKLRHENITIKWACDVLKRELRFLQKKHPKLADALQEEYWQYYENVRHVHDNVFDMIVDNITKENGNNEEKADDCN